MATINISFNTTAKQDEKLAKVLAEINKQRVTAKVDPFATFQDYAKFVIVESVKSYVQQTEAFESREIGEAFKASSDAVQAQVKAALGLS